MDIPAGVMSEHIAMHKSRKLIQLLEEPLNSLIISPSCRQLVTTVAYDVCKVDLSNRQCQQLYYSVSTGACRAFCQNEGSTSEENDTNNLQHAKSIECFLQRQFDSKKKNTESFFAYPRTIQSSYCRLTIPSHYFSRQAPAAPASPHQSQRRVGFFDRWPAKTLLHRPYSPSSIQKTDRTSPPFFSTRKTKSKTR